MTRLLLTGATGFLGKALCMRIDDVPSLSLSISVRHLSDGFGGSTQYQVDNISGTTDWTLALSEQDVVIHAAARVHLMRDGAIDPLTAYRSVNTAGTLNLAQQAAQAGVRRFVFVSSIKVNGERTRVGAAFKAEDAPCPEDAYGMSKYEAEVGLRKISDKTGMEVVIVRPSLVYGPEAKGNFSTMMRWLKRGIPLPLGAVTENRRSMVALDNLVDLLVTCIDHPAAANETFLVSDGEDLSTTDLLCRLGIAMGQPTRLLPVPAALLNTVAKLLGKGDMAQRLLGNLQVNISHTCHVLGWTPPIGVDEGLRRAVQGFDK